MSCSVQDVHFSMGDARFQYRGVVWALQQVRAAADDAENVRRDRQQREHHDQGEHAGSDEFFERVGPKRPHRIDLLRSEIDDYYAAFRVSRDLLELRNLVDCAELIVRSALMRHESRGLHFSRDFPHALPVSFPTVLVRPTGRRRRPIALDSQAWQ